MMNVMMYQQTIMNLKIKKVNRMAKKIGMTKKEVLKDIEQSESFKKLLETCKKLGKYSTNYNESKNKDGE